MTLVTNDYYEKLSTWAMNMIPLKDTMSTVEVNNEPLLLSNIYPLKIHLLND